MNEGPCVNKECNKWGHDHHEIILDFLWPVCQILIQWNHATRRPHSLSTRCYRDFFEPKKTLRRSEWFSYFKSTFNITTPSYVNMVCWIFAFVLPSLDVRAVVVTPFAKMILSWNLLSLNFKWSGLAGFIGAAPILKNGGNVLRGGSLLLALLFLSRIGEPAFDWFPVLCFHGGGDFLKDFCSNLAFADATDVTFSSEGCLPSRHGEEPVCAFGGGVCFCSNLFLNEATEKAPVSEGAAPSWSEDGLKGAFGGGVLFKVRLICWRSFKDSSIPLDLCE